MMNDIKLSLVFCCYNVSEYLYDIYTLLNKQSYQNIEVIFVEDCSTDNTKEKLFSLIKDPRMKIIENEINLGASESRNIGLQNASGDYIGFLDSDDMFDINWLEDIVQAIKSSQSKVIISGMREDYENDCRLEYSKNIVSKYSGYIKKDFVDAIIDLEETLLFGYMNNKFYNTKFLLDNNITCKKMALKEDFEFNINVFKKLDNFYILNKPYYFYKKRRNGNTLTSKFVFEYFDIHENSVFMLKKLLEDRAELSIEGKCLLINRFFRYFLSAIERNANSKSSLTILEQNEWIKKVQLNVKYKWFFDNMNFLSGNLKLLKPFFNNKLSFILIGIGFFIKIAKAKFPVFFVKIKS